MVQCKSNITAAVSYICDVVLGLRTVELYRQLLRKIFFLLIMYMIETKLSAELSEITETPLRLLTRTKNSADADKPARRVWRSFKVTKHSTIPYPRYSFLLCNSNFVLKTRRSYDIRLPKMP